MPITQVFVRMDMTVEEAILLRDSLGTFAPDDPSDVMYRALNVEIIRAQKVFKGEG
jgi:hypothetical protein